MKPQLKLELSLTMLMALLSACNPKAAYAEVPPPTPAPTFAADAADQKVEAVSNEEAQAQDVETVKITDELFVTLEGGLQAAGIATDETTKDKYELVAGGDSGKLWYASIKNRDTGAIVAVVDGSRQWTTDLTQAVQVETVNVIDQLVEAYLNGEIDNVGDLSSAELAEFSKKVTEKKNADRGINPIIYDDDTGNPAYINPDNYMLMNYDGHPDMNETIQMFVPIAGKDEQGNLQFEVDGQIVTIPGSADEDWNMVISDVNDTRIEWPKTKKLSSGMTDVEQKVALFDVVLTPMILLDKNLGQLYLGGTKPLMQSTLRFFQIETDQAGHPLFARKIITHGADYYLSKEGTSLDVQSGLGTIPTYGDFYKTLEINTIYYLGLYQKTEEVYTTREDTIDGYTGVITDNSTNQIILHEKQNDKDMVVTPVLTLMMKNTD